MNSKLAKAAAVKVEPSEPGLPKGILRIADKVTMTDPATGVIFTPRDDSDGVKSFRGIFIRLTGHARGFDIFSYEEDMLLFCRSILECTYYHTEGLHLIAVPEGKDIWEEVQKLRPEGSPWHNLEWFQANMLRWVELMPRPSTAHPGMVAYYQSPQKRLAGILTPIKPGKFLKKFFADILTEEEIQEYGMAWVAAYSPPELFVTQDADEIEQVYRGAYNGSCMHFLHGEWEGDCHPARMYAGPDLAIAYIGDKDAAAARCMVWPEKLIYYPKWYGDYHRLEMALVAAGWKAGTQDDFTGARLRRIYNEDAGFYTVSYSDTHDWAKDDGTHLILANRGTVFLRHTNGTSSDNPSTCRYHCDDCGDGMDEDEGYGTDDGSVCQHCYESNYFHCEMTDEVYRNSERADTPDGTYISNWAIRRDPDRFFYCDGTDMHYPVEDYDYVCLSDGTLWERSYFDRNGFNCEFTEEAYSDDDQRTTSDGRDYSWSAALEQPAQFADWLDDATVETGRDENVAQIELDFDAAAVTADGFVPTYKEPVTLLDAGARLASRRHDRAYLVSIVEVSSYVLCRVVARDYLMALDMADEALQLAA